MYNLPRGYLSYSALSLWKSSKDAYRRKYYSSEDYDLRTPYTAFGKQIAEILEDKEATAAHPILSKIPSYETPEYPLEFEVEGVPIKGYVDSFCPESLALIEYKTGIRSKDGKPTWNALKVRRHTQLPLYCLGIKTLHGDYDPHTQLVWLETEWAEQCEDTYFNDKTFTTCEPQLRLTGDFKTFEREVSEWELIKMKQDIIKAAEEISEDYTLYQKTVDNSVDTTTQK